MFGYTLIKTSRLDHSRSEFDRVHQEMVSEQQKAWNLENRVGELEVKLIQAEAEADSARLDHLAALDERDAVRKRFEEETCMSMSRSDFEVIRHKLKAIIDIASKWMEN